MKEDILWIHSPDYVAQVQKLEITCSGFRDIDIALMTADEGCFTAFRKNQIMIAKNNHSHDNKKDGSHGIKNGY